jgi:hypothetical protein
MMAPGNNITRRVRRGANRLSVDPAHTDEISLGLK